MDVVKVDMEVDGETEVEVDQAALEVEVDQAALEVEGVVVEVLLVNGEPCYMR